MAFQIPRDPRAFGGGLGATRRPRQHFAQHLAYLRTLPCLVSGLVGATEAAHVRYASLAHGKRETGKSEKPDDCWAVPLSSDAHREQHSMSERAFWKAANTDPLVVAALLFASSGNEPMGVQIIIAAQQGAFPWIGWSE